MNEEFKESVDAVLFFDECLPRIEACSKSYVCRDKKVILCRHRFNFSSLVLHANDWVGGHSDFRVALTFLNLIKKQRISAGALSRTKFILVTTDKKFFKSAQKQAETKNRVRLVFDNKKRSIGLGPHSMQIIVIKCKKRRRSCLGDLRCVIETLNKAVNKQQAL